MGSTNDEQELDLIVTEIEQPAYDVRALTLCDPSGRSLPDWTPGAHIDLVLTDELTRQYSLCGSPEDSSTWRVAILREREGTGGSQYIHDKLTEGDSVHVRGPRNHFALDHAERYIFIAGGIGITPLLPMVAHAHASEIPWDLHYGGRSRASLSFADELTIHYGDAVRLYPQDQVGLIDIDAALGAPAPGTLVYCCGPEPLLQAVEQRCQEWPPRTLHVERFAANEIPVGDADREFEVELSESAITLTVPADRSILSIVEDAGVNVLSSCREGTCGTCETGVLSGIVDHRDTLLTAEEQDANDVMFICCSRARSDRLVLEL